MTTIEGVDFSSGGFPSYEGLRAAGKSFVVRYVVNDLAPIGRGIQNAEYGYYRSAGIDVVVVWEGTASRILDGYAAGVLDAGNAVAHIAIAGLPTTIPIYFACDVDATPDDQILIDGYLQGVASVIGIERTGIYGGYWVVSRCATHKTARWFWQTSAWSGGQWFAGNHIEQYDYNVFINGVNCDAVRARVANYGQASMFETHTKPTPAYAPSVGIKRPIKTYLDSLGHLYLALDEPFIVTVSSLTVHQHATHNAPECHAPITKGTRVQVAYVVLSEGELWGISTGGGRFQLKGTRPV